MAIPIDTKLRTTYILKADRSLPPEQQTRFFIAPLSARAERELGALTENGMAFNQGALRGGLKGWENFKRSDGGSIAFDMDADGQPTDATISWISRADKAELATAILELGTSKLSETDVKN